MTQEHLAALSGVRQSVISRVERGERNITLETANRLAQGFGLTLDVFIKEATLVSES